MTMTLRCVHLGELTCTTSCKARRDGGAECEPINSYAATPAIQSDELMTYLYERQINHPFENPVERLAAALEVFAPHLSMKADAEQEELACAWSDYRKDFGVLPKYLPAAHMAFRAGWTAARNGDQSAALR